ncbi:MAG: PorT family protein [Chitinophagales bacterium]|nr:PorT family protein [Chitinophagales bacterium]MDW8417992.1 porin family protein [Chitinophagales bacterium]
MSCNSICRYLALLLLCFATLSSYASFEPDSLKRKAKDPSAADKRENRNRSRDFFGKFSRDRIAIDLLGTNWIYNKNSPRMNGLQTRWYSRGINIYFYYDIRIKKSRFSIAPGLGYSAANIYSRHTLEEDSAGAFFKKIDKPENYKVNKVTLQYFDLPVEFRIKTNPDKFDQMWKFAIGIKAGIRVDAHTKEKTKINNITKVYVERRFPDFNLFRFGPTLRIGYSSFNITAYYGVLDVFKRNRGPKANEFSVGISFNGL